MWRVWITVGSAVWLATISASATINFLAGHQFGRTAIEADVFGSLGVAADAWKTVAPIFIVAVWRSRRRAAAVLAGIVWLACLLFAVSAALGLAAQNRSAVTGNREAVALSYADANSELGNVQKRRANLRPLRAVSEIEQEIAVVLALPEGSRGTIGSLSAGCARTTVVTRRACADVAALRLQLATAIEAHRLDEHITELKTSLAQLRDRGGSLETDPQANLIYRLTAGILARDDVGLAIVLLLVAMVELISAFAPVVLHEYASANRHPNRVAPRRALSRQASRSRDTTPEDIFEYIADRVVPRADGVVSAARLFADYRQWCSVRKRPALNANSFRSKFDAIANDDLGGRVERQGRVYRGLGLLLG